MQDASSKGKKVSKKADMVSDMIVALKEYTAMTRERFSGKQVGSDHCSLGKAIEVLNRYEDLGYKEYVKISKALQQKDMVVFMGMPEHRRKTWKRI
ncbi:hypothetical protein SO802_012871 [Lithocarpus litseifolius]|uniref:Uncharacterized protein n=1 Tax=Lithocarpus litseifolius TaxID=425828 RepID=A0AAW2D423_9ROSI